MQLVSWLEVWSVVAVGGGRGVLNPGFCVGGSGGEGVVVVWEGEAVVVVVIAGSVCRFKSKAESIFRARFSSAGAFLVRDSSSCECCLFFLGPLVGVAEDVCLDLLSRKMRAACTKALESLAWF